MMLYTILAQQQPPRSQGPAQQQQQQQHRPQGPAQQHRRDIHHRHRIYMLPKHVYMFIVSQCAWLDSLCIM